MSKSVASALGTEYPGPRTERNRRWEQSIFITPVQLQDWHRTNTITNYNCILDAMDLETMPRKLWEHPNPKETEMWQFMQNCNSRFGLSMQVSPLTNIRMPTSFFFFFQASLTLQL